MIATYHDRGLIARYRQYLPVTDATPVISLNEGSTPLIYSPHLSALVGRDAQVYIKYEGLNPTGSFKDRGMTMAMSKAVEAGSEAVICASTGNTSASAAAYAARAGISCIVLLPAGKIAMGKLVQAFMYGARVVAIDGNFDDALRLVREIGATEPVAIVNSINPFRIEGQKTASFEIIEELEDAPDLHILPVGNAGNITAYWKGYREFHDTGRAGRLPRMLGFQASGAAPIYYNKVVPNPETVASAIRIGNPASWELATNAIKESNGAIDIVTDAEILDAQRWLASHEGIFVEPASAASIAGLLKCLGKERCAACPLSAIPENARIVCTVTGHGLKDPDIAREQCGRIIPAKAEKSEIMKLIG
ncbi:MAG TPA: threonine synthase [Chthoniobacteraceae bacterium]|nr:threonine synthase [Chthoniobacteraceae bacterium]